MYFFDPESLKCHQIPNDWEDYFATIREVSNAQIKCFGNWIGGWSASTNVNIECRDYVMNIYWSELLPAYSNIEASRIALGNSLYSSAYTPDLLATYLSDFEIYSDLVNKVQVYIDAGCCVIGYDSNVNVDMSILTFTTGNCQTIIGDAEKCTGVFIQQVDDGSEFRGRVTIMKDKASINTNDITVVGERYLPFEPMPPTGNFY